MFARPMLQPHWLQTKARNRSSSRPGRGRQTHRGLTSLTGLMIPRRSALRPLVVLAGNPRLSAPASPFYRTLTSNALSTEQPATNNDGSKVRIVMERPVPFNPLKPLATIRRKTGHAEQVNFYPTPKVDIAALARALQPLCSYPKDFDPKSATYTFGKPCWTLSRHGDAIYRTLALESREIGDQIASRAMKVANEMNHHPTIISISEDEDSSPWHMCIINTTHRPRGLGMRDVRLAEAVNAILRDYNVEEPVVAPTPPRAMRALKDAGSRLGHYVRKTLQEADRASKSASPASAAHPPHQGDTPG